MNYRRLLYIALILLGLVVSGYLLFRGLALLSISVPGTIDLCSELLGAGCDEALLSASSKFLGMPLAGWGVVYYITLLGLLILGGLLREDFDLEATVGSMTLAVIGACVSIFLLVNIVAGWVPFCPLCLVLHTINLLLVVVIWWQSRKSAKQLYQGIRAGGIYLLKGRAESHRRARWKVLGFISVALIAIVCYQWIFVEVRLRSADKNVSFKPRQVLYEYTSAIPQDIPIGAGDPRLGSGDLSVHLVVFNSFQCPGCRKFSGTVHQLASRFGDHLTVIFKHFPLGSDCNPKIQKDLHPWSCLAARAAEAAHTQGKFWLYHDSLFATEDKIDRDNLLQIASDVGLNPVRFEEELNMESIRAKVRSDIDLGISLNVDSTPAIFLNGRRVRNLSLQALDLLIKLELERKKSLSTL